MSDKIIKRELLKIAENSNYVPLYIKFLDQYHRDDFKKGKTQTHHALPKKAWPQYHPLWKHPWNAFVVTREHHFILHCLLFLIAPSNKVLSTALWFLVKLGKLSTKRVQKDLYSQGLKARDINRWCRAYAKIEPPNLNSKNGGFTGHKHSLESKQKISKNHKGMSGLKHSKETRLIMSQKARGKNNGFYGKTHSKKIRLKWSKERSGPNHPSWGKHLSAATKNKLRKAHLGKKASKLTKQRMSKSQRARRR